MKTLNIFVVFLQLKWQETFGAIPWNRISNTSSIGLKQFSLLVCAVSLVAAISIPLCYGLGKFFLMFPIWQPNFGNNFSEVMLAGFVGLIFIALCIAVLCIVVFLCWLLIQGFYQIGGMFKSWLADNWKQATLIVEKRSIKVKTL